MRDDDPLKSQNGIGHACSPHGQPRNAQGSRKRDIPARQTLRSASASPRCRRLRCALHPGRGVGARESHPAEAPECAHGCSVARSPAGSRCGRAFSISFLRRRSRSPDLPHLRRPAPGSCVGSVRSGWCRTLMPHPRGPVELRRGPVRRGGGLPHKRTARARRLRTHTRGRRLLRRGQCTHRAGPPHPPRLRRRARPALVHAVRAVVRGVPLDRPLVLRAGVARARPCASTALLQRAARFVQHRAASPLPSRARRRRRQDRARRRRRQDRSPRGACRASSQRPGGREQRPPRRHPHASSVLRREGTRRGRARGRGRFRLLHLLLLRDTRRARRADETQHRGRCRHEKAHRPTRAAPSDQSSTGRHRLAERRALLQSAVGGGGPRVQIAKPVIAGAGTRIARLCRGKARAASTDLDAVAPARPQVSVHAGWCAEARGQLRPQETGCAPRPSRRLGVRFNVAGPVRADATFGWGCGRPGGERRLTRHARATLSCLLSD